MSNSSIWPIDRTLWGATLIGLRAFNLVLSRVWWEAATNNTLSGATTPRHSGAGSDENEGVVRMKE